MTDLGKIRQLCYFLQKNFEEKSHTWGNPAETISKILKITESMQTRLKELEKPIVQESSNPEPFQKMKLTIKIAAEISATDAISIVKQIVENGKIFTIEAGHKNLITTWLDEFQVFSYKPVDAAYTFSIIPRRKTVKN